MGFPYKLEVFKTIDGTREIETAYHTVFEPYRMRGEWFRIERDLEMLVFGFNPKEKYDSSFVRPGATVIINWDSPLTSMYWGPIRVTARHANGMCFGAIPGVGIRENDGPIQFMVEDCQVIVPSDETIQ